MELYFLMNVTGYIESCIKKEKSQLDVWLFSLIEDRMIQLLNRKFLGGYFVFYLQF
ncbi:hypothetical protein J2810_003622 [Chryseobacterium rhizosphaerae]|nr:hypothetical protein [Chryseobacterium rhizosphaerae]